ncbi:hypothetical protein BpHYR1_022794 [Brachionus plicatilis]|uniref:Uncharacterized protein n=1 Tax=Brachionus plicatilis TaxID=10195 RepID=A0A3M7PTK4_BRAPC|nr:hypothetical protein BpHYR1_022794 [Brachionus plicatilis]
MVTRFEISKCIMQSAHHRNDAILKSTLTCRFKVSILRYRHRYIRAKTDNHSETQVSCSTG